MNHAVRGNVVDTETEPIHAQCTALPRDARIFVAGHRGLVGSAVCRHLRSAGYENLITRPRGDLDLTEQEAVRAFFHEVKPEFVYLCAAKVGGIAANATYPAEFIHTNLAIQCNVIHEAWRSGIRRLLFLGSSCIYPRECPQPIKEEYLLTGPLEATNRAYAVAKIAGVEMCWAYNRQYGTQFLGAMPTNTYGPSDNYDVETSHVLPALIRKMHDAKVARRPTVTAWGSGEPRREFLYVDDLAAAAHFLLALPDERLLPLLQEDKAPLINIGYGKDITIRDLAQTVKAIVGYEGDLVWDSSHPDGTPRKLLDVSRLRSLGWEAKTPLREGIRLAYQQFLEQHPAA